MNVELIRALLAEHDVLGATEEAGRQAQANPTACGRSNDFLTIAARISALTRQWGTCQLLAQRARGDWAKALFAYTASCDLLLRVFPESPSPDWRLLTNLLSEFPSHPVGHELKESFLLQATAYRSYPREVAEIFHAHLSVCVQTRVQTPLQTYRLAERAHRLLRTDDWVLQVDAGEIGNEARYCNHADVPNAILVPRPTAAGKLHPHIVALREINSGDEITINYGASYWASAGPGADPLRLGQTPITPFSDCIYFDGVVEDFACSNAPGGFLIPPHERRVRRRSDELTVRTVGKNHPAYPGFGVFAEKGFSKNHTICVYAGIVDCSPFSGRHASKYTVDLSGANSIGAFGFAFDPNSLTCLPKQRFMPFLTAFPDTSIPGGEFLLDGLESINEAGEAVTAIIVKALLTPAYRDTIQEKLKEIPPPFANPNRKDQQDWARLVRRTFEHIFAKPPKRRRLEDAEGLVRCDQLDRPDCAQLLQQPNPPDVQVSTAYSELLQDQPRPACGELIVLLEDS